MKLMRRGGPPRALEPDDSRLVIYLYLLLREGIPACRTLTERHRAGEPAPPRATEALAWAEAIAYAYSYANAFIMYPDDPLLERLPEELNPLLALMALSQLAYAFCALAEEDPVEQALLFPEELDGLTRRYALKDWLAAVGKRIDSIERSGNEPPRLVLEVSPLRGPVPEGGMTLLRRFLLIDEIPDEMPTDDLPELPDELPREAFFLFMRFRAMAILLAYRGELYGELRRQFDAHGPSAELDAAAVEAAVDIACVLQSLWRERDLVLSARGSALDSSEANSLLGELCFSFILLTSPHEGRDELMLDPEVLDVLLGGPKLTRWVSELELEATFVADTKAALRHRRADGAAEEELLDLVFERLGGDRDR